MQKLSKLEAIRGFAAVYVVLNHSVRGKVVIGNVDLSLFFRFGPEAVMVFFVLSGIVISMSFQKGKDKSFVLYFLKRFLRIYIPLIIIFICNYLIFYFTRPVVKVDYFTLLGNLLMLQDNPITKLNVVCKPFLENSPLWSLTYEWWFYMAFYFFTFFIRKNTSFWMYVICISSAISYMFHPFIVNRTLMYLLIWWIGADIGKLYLNGFSFNFKNLWRQLAVLLLCIGILIINLIINKDEWSELLNVKSPGFSPWLEVRHFVCAFIVIVSALIWRKLNWFCFNSIFGIFERIAPISFGIYISHYFLISYATYLDFIPSVFLRYSLYIIICLTFSYLVERVIYVKLNKIIMNKYYYNKAKAVSV